MSPNLSKNFEELEVELRRARRTGAETSALSEMLESNAPLGFGFVDREFRIVRVRETLAAVNGSTVAKQIGQPVAALVPQLWAQLEPLYRRGRGMSYGESRGGLPLLTARDPRPQTAQTVGAVESTDVVYDDLGE